MNFFNDIKHVDFPITLGGLIEIQVTNFYSIISNNMEWGSTYRFTITSSGNPLTKDGVPFDSILFTLPNAKNNPFFKELLDENTFKSDDIKISLFNLDNMAELDVSAVPKEALIRAINNISLLDLQWRLEEMVRKSDLIMQIYAEKNLIPTDRSVSLNVFENSNLNLSLTYYKSNI